MEPWQEPRHGRGWLILLLGIVVFAAFGAVVGYAYLKGLPGIGGEPPLIRAAGGPLPRTRPATGAASPCPTPTPASSTSCARRASRRGSSGSCRPETRRPLESAGAGGRVERRADRRADQPRRVTAAPPAEDAAAPEDAADAVRRGVALPALQARRRRSRWPRRAQPSRRSAPCRRSSRRRPRAGARAPSSAAGSRQRPAGTRAAAAAEPQPQPQPQPQPACRAVRPRPRRRAGPQRLVRADADGAGGGAGAGAAGQRCAASTACSSRRSAPKAG